MSIPVRVLSYLQGLGINYQIIPLPVTHSLSEAARAAAIPRAQLVRCVLLDNGTELLLALAPTSHLLDFSTLASSLGQTLTLCDETRATAVFEGYEAGCRPPLPELLGLSAVVDTSLLTLAEVYIEPGCHDCLLKLQQSEFTRLVRQARPGQFSIPEEKLRVSHARAMAETPTLLTPLRMRQRVEETFDLPTMPAMAEQILKLRVDPHATAADLAKVVNSDPSLAAQIISWASSPYYGYQGTIRSVEDGIMRVLGFELVLNLALGLAVGKTLRVPHDGPLGLRAFWRQAIYTAVLTERLVRLMPARIRPQRGLAYLAGLLHNFGHLLLGHVFPPQFFLVNRYVEINPQLTVASIESHVLGVDYREMGTWLMQAWHMPDEMLETVRHHHQESIDTPYSPYSNAVLLACRLLARIGMSDERNTEISARLLEMLGLKSDEVEALFEEVMAQGESLDQLSRQLAA